MRVIGKGKVVVNRRLGAVVASVGLVVGLAVIGIRPTPVHAFSGSGNGSAANPYQISTCEQLQEINNDLSADYTLTGNIDCSGSSSWNGGNGFVPIGQSAPFTGYLNGQNYAVDSLYMNAGSNLGGVFAQTEYATIENISFNGGSVQSSNASNSGGIIANATDTTLSDCASTMTVSAARPDGLVGYMNGGTISGCSFNGTVSATSSVDGYEAGIVGITNGANIINDYSAGTIAGNYYVGGLVGALNNSSTLRNSYSSAAVQENASGQYVGGLIGTTGVVGTSIVADNFFAGSLTPGSATYYGGIAASNGGSSFSGNYYDTYACGCTKGVGNGTDTTTAVNSGNSAPDYFKNNSSSAPLNNWDFSGIWQTNASSYPTLRTISLTTDSDGDGVPDVIENAAPNGGDVDADGALDSTAANTTSLIDPVSQNYAAVATNCDANGNVSIAPESANAVSDSSFDYPLGMLSADFNCGNGVTADVTQYYFTSMSPAGLVVRAYNATTKTYQAVPGATITQVTVGGKPALKVTYQITDGSTLDEDGSVNGVIVDPVGLAQAVVAAPNTGGPAGNGATTPLTPLLQLAAAGGL